MSGKDHLTTLCFPGKHNLIFSIILCFPPHERLLSQYPTTGFVDYSLTSTMSWSVPG